MMEQPTMVNEEYEPSRREDVVLGLIRDGRDTGEPWGRVNPLYVREHSEMGKGQAEYALSNLKKAGWVRRLNSGGLYEYVEDPREELEEQ